jgi:hypothetical protein
MSLDIQADSGSLCMIVTMIGEMIENTPCITNICIFLHLFYNTLSTTRNLILPEYNVVLTDSNIHLYLSDAASDGK